MFVLGLQLLRISQSEVQDESRLLNVEGEYSGSLIELAVSELIAIFQAWVRQNEMLRCHNLCTFGGRNLPQLYEEVVICRMVGNLGFVVMGIRIGCR